MSMQLFVPITKVDAAQRLVYGTIAEEIPDKAGELFDYESSKPYFEQWSGEIARATDGKSVGNLRAMHGAIAAGKLSRLSFDDAGKRIEAVGKVVDDAEWLKVVEGVYTGFSIGGNYVERWPDADEPALTRYTAEPIEVSLVDNPCIPSATFSVIKTDGSVEERSFRTGGETADARADRGASSDAGHADGAAPVQPRQIWDCGIAGHAHVAKAEAARCIAARAAASPSANTPASTAPSGQETLGKADASPANGSIGDALASDGSAPQTDAGLTEGVFGPPIDLEGAVGPASALPRLLAELRATLGASSLEDASAGGKPLSPAVRAALAALASALEEDDEDEAIADADTGTDIDSRATPSKPSASARRKPKNAAAENASGAGTDLAAVQSVHDLAAALGAACDGKAGNAHVGALTQMLARRDRLHRAELAKRLDERESAFAEMRSAHEAQLAAIKAKHGEALAAIAALETRLATLEAQPVEPKGKLKMIEKGTDLGANGAAAPEIDAGDTLALIKQAQKNPKRIGVW